MCDFLRCKYNNCNKLFINPILLPCKKNICKTHVDDLLKQQKNCTEFKCQFCKCDHEIPINGFTINEQLLRLLNWHLKRENESNKLKCNKFDSNESSTSTSSLSSSRDFESINENNIQNNSNNQDEYIYEYITNVRDKIDIERELLISKIDFISADMIDKLKLYELECKSNIKKLDDLFKQNQTYLDGLDAKSLEWENDLRTTKLDDRKAHLIMNDIYKHMCENDDRFISLKNNILTGKYSNYFKCKLDIKQGSPLNELKNPNQHNKILKLNETRKKLNLFTSTILSSQFQVNSLIKLCNFSETDIKFELIYRASVDGFGAEDFHRQCDGISKTLTIIKVKGNSNIFGGYTDAAWDSSNNFKEDHNAFIFSLVNKENKPVKIPIKKNDFADAIYCSSCCGPAFGFRDIQIASDSNKNTNSYSHLGYNFTHSEFACDSKKSRCFLARTLYFTTEEIEVYRMFFS
jgi:hypothetical protein